MFVKLLFKPLWKRSSLVGGKQELKLIRHHSCNLYCILQSLLDVYYFIGYREDEWQ